MKPYIVINKVSFKYRKGSAVLEDISLEIYNGETTIIVGRNGSGKTTLSKLIAGMLHPESGKVLIRDEDTLTLGLGGIGSRMGYVFQAVERQLFGMSVIDELTFVPILKGEANDSTYDKADKLLLEFELSHLKDRHPSTLSYGEKRRLAIAASLMSEPEYLVLDEPTSSLDPERIMSLSETLTTLKSKGIGLLIISHDEDFTQQHADRIIRLEEGRVTSDIRP